MSQDLDRLEMSSRDAPTQNVSSHAPVPRAVVATTNNYSQQAFPFLVLRVDNTGTVLATIGGNPGAFGLTVDDLSGLRLSEMPGFSSSPAARSAFETEGRKGISVFSYDLVAAHGKTRHDIMILPAEAESSIVCMRDVSALVSALETLDARAIRGKKNVETMHEISLMIGGDRASNFRNITQLASKAMDVARASIWLFNEDRSAIICKALHANGVPMENCAMELKATDYPAYFAALDAARTLVADDAEKDTRTSEFRDGYLRPLGITSMLDTAILVGRHTAGVVCLEHVGPMRRWGFEEQQLAASLADFATIVMADANRLDLEEQLRLARQGAAAGSVTEGTALCAQASAAGIPR